MRWCDPTPRVLSRRGDEPATARSPLRLRLILSVAAVPLFAATAVFAAYGMRGPDRPDGPLLFLAVACAAVTLAALVDIAVLRCRLRVARATATPPGRRVGPPRPPGDQIPAQRGSAAAGPSPPAGNVDAAPPARPARDRD